MRKVLFTLLSFVLIATISFAQDEKPEKKEDKPVRTPWDSEFIIDNVTSILPIKNTFEYTITHRFGKVNQNGLSDVFGIYAPGANIRLGFYYTPIENLMLGYGLTKKNMYNDFSVKYGLLTQTRSGRIPVSVTLYGIGAIDGRSDEVFGETYKFSSRFSYFGQLIVDRKFNDWLSLAATGSFSHYNMVADNQEHDRVGLGIYGQVKVSFQSSIIFQYDVPLNLSSVSEQLEFTDANKSLANFAIGFQTVTSAHSFQVYVGSADGILSQDIYNYSRNDFTSGDLMVGFTITRLWNF